MTTPTQHADIRPLPPSPPRSPSPLAGQVGELIRRHLAGDPDAVTELTRHVRPWIHHVVQAFGLSGPTAEDVVQSTLLIMWTHLRAVRDPDAGLSWLATVARREALREIRSAGRYVLVEEPEALTAAADVDVEATALAGLTHAVVRRNVSKLPDRHRQLVERIIQQDRPGYATISASLQMPVGSIGPTRKRILERMRRLLAADPEWDTHLSA